MNLYELVFIAVDHEVSHLTHNSLLNTWFTYPYTVMQVDVTLWIDLLCLVSQESLYWGHELARRPEEQCVKIELLKYLSSWSHYWKIICTRLGIQKSRNMDESVWTVSHCCCPWLREVSHLTHNSLLNTWFTYSYRLHASGCGVSPI
jgi:hypothetical protein